MPCTKISLGQKFNKSKGATYILSNIFQYPVPFLTHGNTITRIGIPNMTSLFSIMQIKYF